MKRPHPWRGWGRFRKEVIPLLPVLPDVIEMFLDLGLTLLQLLKALKVL